MPTSTPVLDNANRADEAPTVTMSSGDTWTDWTNYVAGSLKVVSNQLAGNSAGSRVGAYDSSKPGLGPLEAYLTKATSPGNDNERIDVGVCLVTPNVVATQSGYILRWGFLSAAADTWTLVRIDTVASVTTTTTLATATGDLANGDQIWVTVNAGVITAYKVSGGVATQMLQATDATYPTGYIGCCNQGGAARADDFGGGNLNTPSQVTNPIQQMLLQGPVSRARALMMIHARPRLAATQVFQVTAAATQTQAGSVVLQPQLVRSATQAQSVSVVRGIARNIAAIAQATVATVTRALTKGALTASEPQTATVTRLVARAWSAVQTQTVVLVKQPQLVRSASQPQSVTVTSVLVKLVTVAASQATSVVVSRLTSRSLATTQAQTATTTRMTGKVSTATEPQSVVVTRQMQLHDAATVGEVVTVLRQIQLTRLATQAEAVTAIVNRVRLLVVSAGQAASVVVLKRPGKTTAAAQPQTVTVGVVKQIFSFSVVVNAATAVVATVQKRISRQPAVVQQPTSVTVLVFHRWPGVVVSTAARAAAAATRLWRLVAGSRLNQAARPSSGAESSKPDSTAGRPSEPGSMIERE